MKNHKEFTPIRLSHLLRYCSVGAIIRSSDFLVTVKDTSFWTDGNGHFAGRVIPYVEQVKKSLNIEQELREPPIGSLNHEGDFDRSSGHYIQAQIFPSYFVCNNAKCGRLHFKPHLSASSDQSNRPLSLLCQSCHGKLEQVNLVQVDSDGYLSDVPWYRIAHANQAPCRWQEHYLSWHTNKNKSADYQYEVSCSCGAKGGFDVSKFRYYQGYEQPWSKTKIENNPQDNTHLYQEKPQPTAQIMEVNDTRVHTPINVVALVIPPESRIARGTLTDKLYRHPKREQLISMRQNGEDDTALTRELRLLFECDKTALEQAITDIENGYPLFSHALQDRELPELEYEALTTPLVFDDDEDFVTHHFSDEFRVLTTRVTEPVPKKIGQLIDDVVAVNKLKEILVFKGFMRGGIEAEPKKHASYDTQSTNETTQDHASRIVAPDLGKGVGWLPALELYGEGIFITFNQDVLKRWEADPQVIRRCGILAERYQKSHLSAQLQKALVLTPRFLWLHAFSHLLIKEIESLAGYPAASLREKIYSSPSIDEPMAGILIYTVIADVDGTLGGLVELSEPKRLLKVLTRVYEKMQWCSLDPVCAGHEGQGPSLLNLAACHGCLLLPETSCMCGNVLLDRVLLKGDKLKSEPLPSIFDFM